MGPDKGRDAMKSPINDLGRYRTFLESIPLSKYREELKDIKWVEQDLPKEILPLRSIFKYYWEDRNFLSFEEWFENFWTEINQDETSKKALDEFKKYYFNRTVEENDWFKKGFKARMYRTWVSVLTQLDFCYVYERIAAQEGIDLPLECNAELDARGIDFEINEIGFQIAKISQRKEARTSARKKKVVTIPYAVFNIKKMEKRAQSPRVKDTEGYKKSLEAFNKYFIRLSNGFVVFQETIPRLIIDHLDDANEIRKIMEKVFLELSGD
jgi:hypothetical protein